MLLAFLLHNTMAIVAISAVKDTTLIPAPQTSLKNYAYCSALKLPENICGNIKKGPVQANRSLCLICQISDYSSTAAYAAANGC